MALDLFTADGEGVDIEDLQRTVLDGGFDLGDLFSGAFGAGTAQSGDHVGAVGVAARPVDLDLVCLALLGQAQSAV